MLRSSLTPQSAPERLLRYFEDQDYTVSWRKIPKPNFFPLLLLALKNPVSDVTRFLEQTDSTIFRGQSDPVTDPSA